MHPSIDQLINCDNSLHAYSSIDCSHWKVFQQNSSLLSHADIQQLGLHQTQCKMLHDCQSPYPTPCSRQSPSQKWQWTKPLRQSIVPVNWPFSLSRPPATAPWDWAQPPQIPDRPVSAYQPHTPDNAFCTSLERSLTKMIYLFFEFGTVYSTFLTSALLAPRCCWEQLLSFQLEYTVNIALKKHPTQHGLFLHYRRLLQDELSILFTCRSLAEWIQN